MDGVTILQTMPAFTIKEFIILTIIILFLFLLGFISILKLDALLGGVFMAIALMVAVQGVSPHPKQYKITVSDTVSYNELTAKYNIIDTDGKIITVEEKDNGKDSD